jgi:aryl-alcohol dehydrogenase-like predicted oxidoreductase
MTFGTQTPSKKEAFKIMDKAYDAGINFFDTAELYPVPPEAKLAGITEEIVGEWMATKPRDSVILATKVAGAASGWFVPPIRHGLTAIDRFHIERAIEGSLKRLKTDYIDLYQVHWPDQIVPIEESMAALDRLVQSGKVRYLGTSNDTAYGVTKANTIAHYEKYARFESVQNNFSLLNRRDLDALAEVYRKESVSLLPYSPLAGGVLTGKYNHNALPDHARFSEYVKSSNPRQQAMAQRFYNEKTIALTEQYTQLANEVGMSVTTLATAWSMHFDFVASTIIGARTANQLDDTLKALTTPLSKDILNACDAINQTNLYAMG